MGVFMIYMSAQSGSLSMQTWRKEGRKAVVPVTTLLLGPRGRHTCRMAWEEAAHSRYLWSRLQPLPIPVTFSPSRTAQPHFL